ncbi:MAG: DNA polymerase III subunit gamma/tau [Candidatus Peregrinibacteria bacterium]
MEQIALYRKYRPYNFDNLVGQDHIKNTLINAFKTSHVSHAYLFSGPRGTGKTSTARLIAKALNCKNPTDGYEPCNECEFCKDINDGKLFDIIEIDAASNRGIDEVRDLREKINFAPTRAKYKVYIVDEVHMMTKEAFNALLKTLEEPPPHAYFILATTEIHKIPDTIISRCQRFDFKRINDKALMTRLSFIAQTEKIAAEDKALEAISKYVDGGLRDAIGLLEQLTTDGKLTFSYLQEVLGISDMGLIDALYNAINSGSTRDALKIIQELHDQGGDLKRFAHEFIDHLRNEMLASVNNANYQETSRLVRIIDIFQDAQVKLQSANIPQLPLEMAVIRLMGPVEEENKMPTASTDFGMKEAVAKPAEQKPVSAQKITFDVSSLRENWPRITERVKVPALKMSLKNAVPIEVSAPDVTLQFNTKFHKDKVMEHAHRIELESLIRELTGESAKILSIVKEIEIKPVVDEQGEDRVEGGHALDEALNIFGGKVVD